MSQRPIHRATTATLSSFRHLQDLPVFLAPSLASQTGVIQQAARFSASIQLWKWKWLWKLKRKRERELELKKRDSNPNRGVSALRRTGLRYPVSMSKVPLPEPVLDPEKRSKPTVDENHGLWGFFNEKKTTLSTPQEDESHGIALRNSKGGPND